LRAKRADAACAAWDLTLGKTPLGTKVLWKKAGGREAEKKRNNQLASFYFIFLNYLILQSINKIMHNIEIKLYN